MVPRCVSCACRLGDTIAGQVTSQSDKFISSFNTSYVMVKGFIGHTGAKVRSTATQIRTEALQRLAQQLPGTPKAATPTAADVKSNSAAAAVGSNTGANAASLTKTDIAELQLAIESVVLTALHKKIFTGLCELYAVEDQRTAGMCRRCSSAARVH